MGKNFYFNVETKNRFIVNVRCGQVFNMGVMIKAKSLSQEEIEEIVGEYADATTLGWYVANYGTQDMPILENWVMKSGDLDKMIKFSPCASDEALRIIEEKVKSEGSFCQMFNFAALNDPEDIKFYEDKVVESGDVNLVIGFARSCKNADTERLQNFVLEHGNEKQKLEFLFSVESSDARLVREVLGKDYLIEKYIADNHSRDQRLLQKKVVELGEVKFVKCYMRIKGKLYGEEFKKLVFQDKELIQKLREAKHQRGE